MDELHLNAIIDGKRLILDGRGLHLKTVHNMDLNKAIEMTCAVGKILWAY